MRLVQRLAWVFFLGYGFSSCVKEVPVDGKVEKPNAYFLNAFLTTDSQARIQLGKVSGISEPYDFVSDADVVLIAKGNRYPLTYLRDGWYSSSLFEVRPNDSVLVEVRHRGLSFAKTLRIPPKIKIQTVQTFPVIAGFIGRTQGFRVRFKDSAYTDNFYRIWVEERFWEYVKDTDGNADSVFRVRRLPIASTELAVLRNPYQTYTNRELLFADETFNGLTVGFEFYRSLGKLANERTESYKVVVENVHQDLYHFYNDRNAHLWQQQSITQTPTRVEGNLGNVYGIFGAYQLDAFEVR